MRIKMADVELIYGVSRDLELTVGPQEFRKNNSLLVDPVDYVQGTEGGNFNRGNKRCRITFGGARQHASVQDAEYFVLRHDLDLPNEGTVVFTAINAAGAEISTWLEDAVMESNESWHTGATSFHRYVIVGGIMTETEPES